MMQPSDPHLPASPCAMTPEADHRLAAIESTLGEIKGALIGNAALGHKGLVSRVEQVESTTNSHDRKLIAWGAVVAAVPVGIELVKYFHP